MLALWNCQGLKSFPFSSGDGAGPWTNVIPNQAASLISDRKNLGKPLSRLTFEIFTSSFALLLLFLDHCLFSCVMAMLDLKPFYSWLLWLQEEEPGGRKGDWMWGFRGRRLTSGLLS